MNRIIAALVTLLVAVVLPVRAAAQDEAELAKKTQNPVADLISVPLQNNCDFSIGPKDGWRYTLNIQPVVPLSISDDAMLIIRTIVPVIYQENVVPRVDKSTVPPTVDFHTSQAGLGDITQSFFLAPKQTVGGWIVGAGPVFLWPAATDDILGSEKWGAGPTAVVLQQQHGWTYGMLANHIWSYAGDDDRPYVSTTFLQPFVSYVTKTYTTFGFNTESSYDWHAAQWTVPLNLSVSQLLKLGKLPVQLGVGGRLYVERPAGGPDWGLRFTMTFLFPK